MSSFFSFFFFLEFISFLFLLQPPPPKLPPQTPKPPPFFRTAPVRGRDLLLEPREDRLGPLLRALRPQGVEPQGDQRVARGAPGPGQRDAQGLEGPDVAVGLVGSWREEEEGGGLLFDLIWLEGSGGERGGAAREAREFFF